MSASDHPPTQSPPPTDIRARLRALAHELEHVLPAQAPIRDFVHHNTLHGYQHLPFHQGLAAMRALTGIRPWMLEAEARRRLAAGRIDESDLRAAITALFDDDHGTPSRHDILLAALRSPVAPLSPAQLSWEFEENRADSRIQPGVPAAARHRLLAGDAADETSAVSALWRTCIDLVDRLAPVDEVKNEASDARIEAAGASTTAALWNALGTASTWRELLRALTGEDLLDYIRPLLVRQFAAQLDIGLAAWHHPLRPRGLFATWKACTLDDPERTGDSRDLRALAVDLPDDPLEAVITLLQRSELEEERWPGYLTRLALHLPGWAGMVLWREMHPAWGRDPERGRKDGEGGGKNSAAPVAILDFLAVFLAYERFAASRIIARHWDIKPTFRILRWYFDLHPAEALVRHARFAGRLDEASAERTRGLIGDARAADEARIPEWTAIAGDIVATGGLRGDQDGGLGTGTGTGARARAGSDAWPLFVLAQHLGLAAEALHRHARALRAALVALDADTRGRLWLLAYEQHYREQVLATLAANRARRRSAPATPSAQLVFCMDEREEGMRRHLEELAPDVATFGAAGFFTIAMHWTGIDDPQGAPLCPVVVTPAHAVAEVAAAGAEAAVARHRDRRERRRTWKQRLFQDTRQGGPLAIATSLAAAPASLAVLAGKVLAPGFIGRLGQALATAFDGPAPTRAAFNDPAAARPAGAEAPPPAPGALLSGFTDAEQAERIAGMLRTLGLVDNFAPLVAIVGHGSHSLNNPHRSAYDCGACGGKHGGPNARVFAAMANRPPVRARLAKAGITIPATTHFVGLEHDTCNDSFTLYDRELLPEAAQPELARLERRLAEAGRRHAEERCRRFASAPAGLDPETAQGHAASRAADFAQARPELGHVTNATAIIGRRSMTRGIYFDRRSFLISYDPTLDADGRILEGILLAAGPVGAGINLEYYFSTVNNEALGCNSKVTHNLAGLVGVMEGAASDLRTGLPRQMIEIHEAMLLLIVCESTPELLTKILGRQPALMELVGNGWVQLAAQEPLSGTLHVFTPETGWQRWTPSADAPPTPVVSRSRDWFAGQIDHLPPALVEAA